MKFDNSVVFKLTTSMHSKSILTRFHSIERRTSNSAPSSNETSDENQEFYATTSKDMKLIWVISVESIIVCNLWQGISLENGILSFKICEETSIDCCHIEPKCTSLGLVHKAELYTYDSFRLYSNSENWSARGSIKIPIHPNDFASIYLNHLNWIHPTDKKYFS